VKRYALIAALTLAFAASAHAATISGLVNTGTGATGSQDTNYQLSVLTGNTVLPSNYGYVTDGALFPIGPWIANSADSKWITPFADQATSLDPTSAGTYDFHLSFTVTGDASTAALLGRFAVDNSATIVLNGQTIGSGGGITSWTDFSASAGFVSGVNSLDFIVYNNAQSVGNPMGLRVEFTPQDVAAAVPEPATYGMLLAGLCSVGLAARRRAKVQTRTRSDR
jgi:hypothetical protein